MSDIEKRLRDYAENYSAHTYLAGMCTEAADRIEELDGIINRALDLPGYDEPEGNDWIEGHRCGMQRVKAYLRAALRVSDEHPKGEDPKGLRAKPASAARVSGDAHSLPPLHLRTGHDE